MRKKNKILLLTIDLIIFAVSTGIGFALKYSDVTSHTDLFSKYAFYFGIPAVISFIVMIGLVAMIMIRGKSIY